jgi:hypothetical protein
MKSKLWKDLIKHLQDVGQDANYICKNCLQQFRKNIIPSTCFMNKLYVRPVPEVIAELNDYERILIQKAKAFQTVQKMGTVAKKNLPHRDMISKVKGRTFHLPLPMEETLKKLCPSEDPINLNHELYIITVRGVPTKSKVIWEELVDVKKVFKALSWLKANNPLYSEIKLPESADVLLDKLRNVELVEEIDEDTINENNVQEQIDGNIGDETDKMIVLTHSGKMIEQ